MSDQLPPCPACSAEYVYEDGALLVCPMCGHEWSPASDALSADAADSADTDVVTDAFGTPLTDGDSVTIIKDLKVKGGSGPIKVGTKVRNIRLVDPVNGHDIDARVDGFGSMKLKSSVVKKS